jgi:hypothetical protein
MKPYRLRDIVNQDTKKILRDNIHSIFASGLPSITKTNSVTSLILGILAFASITYLIYEHNTFRNSDTPADYQVMVYVSTVIIIISTLHLAVLTYRLFQKSYPTELGNFSLKQKVKLVTLILSFLLFVASGLFVAFHKIVDKSQNQSTFTKAIWEFSLIYSIVMGIIYSLLSCAFASCFFVKSIASYFFG